MDIELSPPDEGKRRTISQKLFYHCPFLTYPNGVYFIFGNEFCERFSFHGMRVILSQYLLLAHGLSETNVKLVYHFFVAVCYFAPLLGSFLADGYFGKYHVILGFSLLYCVGHGFMSIGAIPSVVASDLRFLDYVGLFLIALSTGGIKPCILPFAADQFPPERSKDRAQYFSFFFVAVGIGSLCSMVLTPLLRYRVQCFGSSNCFPLAFGVPAVLMLTALLILIAGKRWYTVMRKPSENIVVKLACCIFRALKIRLFKHRTAWTSSITDISRNTITPQHWLDYAESAVYDRRFITDIKGLFTVAVLLIPAVFYWSLQGQSGSSWILQGNMMNGRVGTLNLLPEQMPMLFPLFMLVFVVFVEAFLYPYCARWNFLNTRLQKMGCGCVLLVLAYSNFSILQLFCDHSALSLPPANYSRFVVPTHVLRSNVIRFCDDDVINHINDDVIKPLISIDCNGTVFVNHRSLENITLAPERAYLLSAFEDPRHNNSPNVQPMPFRLQKAKDGNSTVYLSLPGLSDVSDLLSAFILLKSSYGEAYKLPFSHASVVQIKPNLITDGRYVVYVRRLSNFSDHETNMKPNEPEFGILGTFEVASGGVYCLELRIESVNRSSSIIDQLRLEIFELVPANSVSLFYQILPYLLATMSEVMFEITALEFVYSQAAHSMKTIMGCIWYFTITAGNLLNMTVFGSRLFESRTAEFISFTFVMMAFTALFVWLAKGYTYVDRDSEPPQSAISS